MNYYCRDERRRSAIKSHPLLNGIDFLEVVDRPNDPVDVRQTVLTVHFINPVTQGSLLAKNFRVEGGERITGIKVIGVDIISGSPPLSPLSPLSPPADSRIAVIKLDRAGDFSTYTLRIIQDEDHPDPPVGIDPILSSIEFSFKVLCQKDFDCKPVTACEEDHLPAPDINYLAKDYASFRQLMLDRLAVLVPKWKERNPADIGVVMLELLAYAGDLLSYRQDAIATEAYLGTSRLRTSVRRHARLVDYYMHDGCNARMFVHVDLIAGIYALELKAVVNDEKTKVATQCYGITNHVFSPTDSNFEKIIGKKPIDGRLPNEFDFILPLGLQIYEVLHDVTLDSRHNEIQFYTWLNDNCTLPKGATSATLLDHLPVLKPGHVLMLTEIAGPITGKKSDADPSHRHPVKLTSVTLSTDPINNQNITKIEWAAADALPFPLCISSVDATGQSIKVSVAQGNMVLVDHGFTIHELLPTVPDPATSFRYRPTTRKIPMTQAAPFDDSTSPSAAACLAWTMRSVKPEITLKLEQNGVVGHWDPRRDLLASIHNDEHFVVEVESNGVATLRFGNGVEGKQPVKDNRFIATYRVGNGIAGNVGSDTIKHLITNEPAFLNVVANISNPLPAVGGREMETIEETRNRAPVAFQSRQERAVTSDDYEEVSRWVDPNIQRSAASMRWTGSWRTVFLTVDQLGGGNVTPTTSANLRNGIERYRMAGYDLEIEDPKFVSLEIEMTVCVEPTFFAVDVKKALLQKFSNRTLPGGQRGLFHPDNFSFGKTVYLSPIYEAAQNTDGVKSVRITKFQRLGINDPAPMNNGHLTLSRFEIARLDNDPNSPERGVFTLVMKGGK